MTAKTFFEYTGTCDIVITNPPFRIETPQGRKNALVQCMDKCFDVSRKKVCVLINHKCFNTMTPLRLQKWAEKGWFITNIHVCNVSKWFGRYYFVIFEKDKKPVISFDTVNY